MPVDDVTHRVLAAHLEELRGDRIAAQFAARIHARTHARVAFCHAFHEPIIHAGLAM